MCEKILLKGLWIDDCHVRSAANRAKYLYHFENHYFRDKYTGCEIYVVDKDIILPVDYITTIYHPLMISISYHVYKYTNRIFVVDEYRKGELVNKYIVYYKEDDLDCIHEGDTIYLPKRKESILENI